MNELESLELQIAEKIKDYRKGELSFELDKEHVNKWINQFGEERRVTILKETLHLINRYYMSPIDLDEYISEILTFDKIFTKNPKDEINSIQFLDVQNKGSSQKNLLSLLNEKSLEIYSQGINRINTPNTKKYIYVDDGLYSGSTVRHDIERWISFANPDTELHMIFLCVYSSGCWYTEKKIREVCDLYNIKLYIWWCHELKNFPQNKYGEVIYDCFWPQKVDDTNCDAYIEAIKLEAEEKEYSVHGYREIVCSSNVFSCEANRVIIEQEFMKAGAYITTLPSSLNTSMRPMGYDYFASVGFGAFFVTYMNISNNCPLALWWGDPEVASWHTLSKWYPLFPRRGNITGDDFIW